MIADSALPGKILPHHLARKAILYVRQSSAHQVLHNHESSALQYAMRGRLTALGWSVGPGAIAAEAEAGQRRDQARHALMRDLEATRYAADNAFRQYDAADPANRLVTGELEVRWNKALTRVAEVEAKIAAHDATLPALALPASLTTLAADLKAVWDGPTTDARLKKRIVRTVIQEIVADIDKDAAEIVLIVHWIGGVHTELRLPARLLKITPKTLRLAAEAGEIAAVHPSPDGPWIFSRASLKPLSDLPRILQRFEDEPARARPLQSQHSVGT